MTPSETLHCTVDDLVHHFAELAAAHAPQHDSEEQTPAMRASGGDDSPDLAYDLTTFPLLPDGDSLGPDAPASDVNIVQLAERLGSGLITLSGPRLRGAATVEKGQLTDAVWIDSQSHALGETAAMALMGARDGRVDAVRFEPDVAEALALLWRLPVEQRAMNLKWLNPEALMTSFTRDGADRAVLVDAQTRAVGLFMNGLFVAAYSSEQRRPTTDPNRFQQLLSQAEGRITVLRRPGRDIARRLAASQPPAHAALAAPPPAAPDEQMTATEPPSAIPAPATAAHPSGEPAAAIAAAAEPEVAGDLNVDFAEVRRELVQICVSWLGEKDSGRVIGLIEKTRPSVDDVVALIDTVRSLTVPGHESSVIAAMARELQVRAAERLCAA